MSVRMWAAVGSLGLAAAALAQGGTGTIAGKVTNQNGAVVTGVSVVARNTADASEYKAAVGSQGEYTLTQLPPGTYDVSIPQAGAYSLFVQKGVTVEAGRTLQLDIAVKWEGNLFTIGDSPRELADNMRAANVPTGPTPRMPDGKPDLSGIWLNERAGDPPPLPLQPWAAAIQKERQDKKVPSPLSQCLPSTPIPILATFPYMLAHARSVIVMIQDFDFAVRQVFIDGRRHPTDWNPSWMGHSIGRWEGDTLVVDTVGFNDRSWLQSAPHTEQLHVVERIRRPDAGHLEVEVTVEDPGAFTGVWKRQARATLADPDEEILEYICER